jgi:hypothetical protein
MTIPSLHWRACAPVFRQIRNLARQLFIGVCVGLYLMGMTWILWRIK